MMIIIIIILYKVVDIGCKKKLKIFHIKIKWWCNQLEEKWSNDSTRNEATTDSNIYSWIINSVKCVGCWWSKWVTKISPFSGLYFRLISIKQLGKIRIDLPLLRIVKNGWDNQKSEQNWITWRLSSVALVAQGQIQDWIGRCLWFEHWKKNRIFLFLFNTFNMWNHFFLSQFHISLDLPLLLPVTRRSYNGILTTTINHYRLIMLIYCHHFINTFFKNSLRFIVQLLGMIDISSVCELKSWNI